MTSPGMSITQLLPDGKLIVLCGRADDASAWQDLLGPARCLAIALDDAPHEARPRTLRGASDHLAWQHHAIGGLDGSGWLAEPADAFDPDHTATLVLPDPLDPPDAGNRRRFGFRRPAWRLFEDKTMVDTLWDAAGVPRAPSIVGDGTADLSVLGAIVDQGTGVVCSCQPRGAGPSAGGDGIWWWREGPPPTTIPTAGPGTWRVRLMPLLEGVPVRLHGLALTTRIIPFPPMELVTLPRPGQGTFLCAGAVPLLDDAADLVTHTERIGVGLRERLGYRGGFSVDGILTPSGFQPTDFNARLTSAMEAAPSDRRVLLHAVNLLAREGNEPDTGAVEQLAEDLFTIGTSCTIFGAATHADDRASRTTSVRWDGDRLVPAPSGAADGRLLITPSPRGWLLTATLATARLPGGGRVGPRAPEIFRVSDEVLGTNFGHLVPPFDTRPSACLPKVALNPEPATR
ncbi:hypothetical protein [Micromonospora sagamiensis]|uniref:Uncharacterized protein n=2 Tax=Micromonospora sagamiensis TaxID=47875 RepID=A0A562WKY9_9ACTN|nr:hypothetical protein [Micromonospora sagamiensis]TWJ30959.1 hypothetical protein JD81_04508 [Micromonospora sagamiensis]BCL16001.1 hypothetical protein GCM10017556_37400 [Micromonospora sagamiensis]